MNDMTGCLHIRQTLGVYVLGAIDPAERATVDAHLAGCPECREELAGLAGLPALLGRVPFGEAERITGFYSERSMPAEQADDTTLAPVLAKVAHQRRVRRWRGLAAAAAVVLAASTAATVSMHVADAPAAVHWQQHDQMTNSATHMSLAVNYASQPGGTKLEAQVTGLPAGTDCDFWVIGPGGSKWPAGSWTVPSKWQSIWYQGSSSVPFKWVQGFELTTGKTVLAMLAT
jgi:anti-sigma-K factor RskA